MFLAIREMKHAKTRYLLISLIMVLIAFLVLFVTGLAQGLSYANASSIQNMKADYLILQQDADHRLNRSMITEDTWKQIQQASSDQQGVELNPLSVKMTSIAKVDDTKKIDATFFGIDPEGALAPVITEGRLMVAEADNEAVADKTFADKGLKLGDMIEDQASGQQYELVGFTEGQSYSHTPVILMSFKGLEATEAGRPATMESTAYNAVALSGSKTITDQITSKVQGIEIVNKDTALKGIPGYQEEQGSLLMMIAFLFIIAAFVLAVFFYVITIQKMNQFGVLKAIGAKNSYLARSLVLQVLTLSLVCLAISILLTYGVAMVLPDSMPFQLNTSVVAGCAVLFIVVSLLGSLLSLYRVVKVDAIEAIGRAM
ncbi:ABC transporter permease [Paenibacillus motobuensis]|uniref:ABC transporter permease n=1 Tax=Paenibacillus TaxID=44249 RepID=UPI002040C9FA|nr:MULTISPECIES: ABC transporter permease [Paenibacillus]MCM3042354.1 ABC transporter permease [Paenibacillus lutimineralis]MCM3649458.1 ABC transporter permease [Paenibacillus motobuensis]